MTAPSVRGVGAARARRRAAIGLTVAMQAMSGLDELQPVAGMGRVGEVRLVPDLDAFRVLPYAPRRGAVLTARARARTSAAIDRRR
jgi:glutamine synthetase